MSKLCIVCAVVVLCNCAASYEHPAVAAWAERDKQTVDAIKDKRLDDAASHAAAAIAAAEKCPPLNLRLVRAKLLYGHVRLRQERYDLARAAFDSARKHLAEGGFTLSLEMMQACEGLAVCHEEAGETARAEELYAMAREIRTALRPPAK